jgi:hypothetical protein
MALNDKDIDADMAADWASIQEKYAVEETPEPVEPVAPGDPAPEPVETIPVSREADGKFKAKEVDKEEKPKVEAKAEKGATEAKAAKAVPDVVDQAAPTDAPQARDINRAPSTWKPTARAGWEKLDPAIRAEIHRREADFQNGQAQLLPDATLGKNMRQVIEPYRMLIDAEGGTPERAVADLLRTAALFRTGSVQQKYQGIVDIAQQFGIDLRYLAQAAVEQGGQPPQQGQPQPNQFRDPRVDQLLAQQNLERQQNAQREQQTMESTVTRWMNEKDAQGNPKREYLGDVINEMSALVPQLRQNDPTLTHAQALDAAYDRAIWAHPEIRTLLAQKQQTELETQRRTENQRRVSDARKAGSVNVPRRGSIPSAGKPGTMEQTIEETARAIGMIS